MSRVSSDEAAEITIHQTMIGPGGSLDLNSQYNALNSTQKTQAFPNKQGPISYYDVIVVHDTSGESYQVREFPTRLY